MSTIDLGSLSYGFVLNLTGFQEDSQRLYRELQRMDEQVQVRLDKIGLRADQAGKRVQDVARAIAESNERAQATIQKLQTTLQTQENAERRIRAQEALNYDKVRLAQERYMAAQQKGNLLAIESARIAEQQARITWLASSRAMQTIQRRVQETSQAVVQAHTHATNVQLENTNRLSKALREQYENKLRYDREEEASEDRKLRNLQRVENERIALMRRRAEAMRSVGIGLAVGGAAVGGPAFAAGRAAASYQRTLAPLQALYGETPGQAARVGAQIRQIGAARGILPDEAAAGFLTVRAMGRSDAEALRELRSASDAAMGTFARLGTVISTVNGVMQAYHVNAARSQQVTDILTQTVAKTGMTWEQAREAFGHAQPIASALGMTVQDLGAAFVTMSRNGVQAGQLGTQLTGAFARLTRYSKQTVDAARAMGLSWIANHQILEHIAKVGVPAAMEEIAKATKGGNLSLVQQLFGGRGASDVGIVALLRNIDQLKKNTADMYHVAGTAARAASVAQQTFNGQLQVFQAHVKNLEIAFGTGLLPSLTKLMQYTNSFLGWLEKLPAPVQKAVAIIGAGSGLGLGLAGAILLAASAVVKFRIAWETLAFGSRMVGAAKAIKNLWSGVAFGASIPEIVAGGGIAGAVATVVLVVGIFAAAVWVGSYIAKLKPVQEAWAKIRDTIKGALADHGPASRLSPGQRGALDAARYVQAFRGNRFGHFTPPGDEGMAALSGQLQARHLGSLREASPGQLAGIYQDLMHAGQLQGPPVPASIRRAPGALPSATGEPPIRSPNVSTAPGLDLTGGGRGGRSINERIARAAEGLVGEMVNFGKGCQIAVDRILQTAAHVQITTHYASEGMAALARIGTRVPGAARGEIAYEPSRTAPSGWHAMTVVGVNPDGSVQVIEDPGAAGPHAIRRRTIRGRELAGLRYFALSDMSGARQREITQAERRAAALQQRRQLAQLGAERTAGLAGFASELHAASAISDDERRILAIEEIEERRARFLKDVALRTARAHNTLTKDLVTTLTRGFEATVAGLRAQAGGRIGRIQDRRLRTQLQAHLGTLAAERHGIAPQFSQQFGSAALSRDQIDALYNLETYEAQTHYRMDLLGLSAEARRNPNDTRVQAFAQERDARLAAAEEQRSRRLDQLEQRMLRNDARQQSALTKQINEAIKTEQYRLAADRTLTPAQRKQRLGAFIQAQAGTTLAGETQPFMGGFQVPGYGEVRMPVRLGEAAAGDLLARGEATTAEGDQLAHSRKYQEAHRRAIETSKLYPDEKDKSRSLLATAEALRQMAYDPEFIEEQAQLLDEADDYTRQAGPEAEAFAQRRQDYVDRMQMTMAVGAARGREDTGKGLFGFFGTGVSREDRVRAAELMRTAVGEQQQARQFGVDISPYMDQVRKQVTKLLEPKSIWDAMVDDAKDKFGDIVDKFSEAVGKMAAHGGNLKKWWKDLWGEIVSWFTSFVVKSVVLGVGRMFGARDRGGDALDALLGSLQQQAFGGRARGAAAGGLAGALGTLGTLAGSAPTGTAAFNPAGSLAGYGNWGLQDFSSAQQGGIGPTIAASAGISSTLSTAAKAGGPLAKLFGSGFAGGLGKFLSGAAPWLAFASLIPMLGGGLFKHLFGHHRFLGIKFDDPVNDFHAAASGRDFTSLFLAGVSHEMATRTAAMVAPAMPGYMASQARSGQETLTRLVPAGAAAGVPSMPVQINHPLLLNRQSVDTITDHVERSLANKLIARARRGTYGGRDRLG